MREPLLSIHGLTKRYPGVLAVDDVDLDIGEREIVGLVGKNGAGKSTLIKLLAGAIAPDAGEIRVLGQLLEHATPQDASRLGIAVVHQQIVGAPDLSVAENVELGLGFPKRFGLVSWKQLYARARASLDLLGFDADPGAQFGRLSVAQQRVVTIARALAWKPRVLILDEPSASLTDQEIERLHQALRELRVRGVTVIYVSHRLNEVLALSDRIVVMRDARVVDDEPTSMVDEASLVRLISGSGSARGERRERPPSLPPGETLLDARGIVVEGVVRGVDLSVREREIVGIAGLAGAGRTELVRAIFGADRASGGEVRLRGRPIRIRSPRDALRAGIALLPEDRRSQGLIADFSVARNISLASLHHARQARHVPLPSAAKERARAREHIERLEIATRSTETAARLLSGGNQQKVVMAKWLEHGADVYIFDEPTNGVDVQGKAEIYDIMRRLAADGRGIVFISSEFAELVEVCHRTVVLREGRRVAELTGEELTEDTILKHCYAAASAV